MEEKSEEALDAACVITCVCVCVGQSTLLAALRACLISCLMWLMFSEMFGVWLLWFCSRSSFFRRRGRVSPRDWTEERTNTRHFLTFTQTL